MSGSNEESEKDAGLASSPGKTVFADGSEVSPEEAEELIKNPEPVLRALQLNPDLGYRFADGFRTLREGISEFFVANDRGADRAKDTADKVIDLIGAELDREGLTPSERLDFLKAGERMAARVSDGERSTRESNEQVFKNLVGVAAGVVVGALVLGYVARGGKLPPTV